MNLPRIVVSSKSHAAGIAIAAAWVAAERGSVPWLYAMGAITLVVTAYIIGTAIEDKGPRTEVTLDSTERDG